MKKFYKSRLTIE